LKPVELLGLRFKTPILTSATPFDCGQHHPETDLSPLGGVTSKSISLRARPGNLEPRFAEAPCGWLNAVGLESKGVRHYLEHELPGLRARFDGAVIASIVGDSAEEFAEVAKVLGSVPDMLEVNLSCPNVHGGKMPFAADARASEEVIRRVKEVSPLPVSAKLSPNADPLHSAAAAERGGADALSMINTLSAMRIDVNSRRPVLANKTGGLSGPALLPVAVRMIYSVYRETDLPIIGMGGVSSHRDALELALAGASLVSVGTAVWRRPSVIGEITAGLKGYLQARGERWEELVGAAHRL
jgi:dihydroorotate dehydrogenase (NAD+) catalytic subunit